MSRFHLTFLLCRKIQHGQRHRAEPPKRARGDDDEDSALLSACHRGLEKVSEHLKDGSGVFSGTGMPDMSDSAWLAIKTKTKTQKIDPKADEKSVEPSQKDVDNMLVTVSFSLDKKKTSGSWPRLLPYHRRMVGWCWRWFCPLPLHPFDSSHPPRINHPFFFFQSKKRVFKQNEVKCMKKRIGFTGIQQKLVNVCEKSLVLSNMV